jgi:hypothetical protein
MDIFDVNLKSSLSDPFYPYTVPDRAEIMGIPVLQTLILTVVNAASYDLFVNLWSKTETGVYTINFCDSFGLFHISVEVNLADNSYQAFVYENTLWPRDACKYKFSSGSCKSYKGIANKFMPNNKTYKNKNMAVKLLKPGITSRIAEEKLKFFPAVESSTWNAYRMAWVSQPEFKDGVLAGNKELKLDNGFQNLSKDIHTALTKGVVSADVHKWITEINPIIDAGQALMDKWQTMFTSDRYVIVSLPNDQGVIVGGFSAVTKPQAVPTDRGDYILYPKPELAPVRYYRSISALDARIHDDVQAALAMAKNILPEDEQAQYSRNTYNTLPISDPDKIILRYDKGFANCGMLSYSPSFGFDTFYVTSVRRLGG